MDKIIFHHAPMSRSNIVHWMFEELRVPYELHAISLDKGDHKKPEYLKINPVGKVPAITHQGAVITEAAAICAYLADEFPAAHLAVPRLQSSCGDYYTVMEVVAQAVKDGPYLLGQHFTAADVVLGSCLQYGTMIKAAPGRAGGPP